MILIVKLHKANTKKNIFTQISDQFVVCGDLSLVDTSIGPAVTALGKVEID
jgi:hypothetical protein